MEAKANRKDPRNWYYPGKILPRFFSNIVETHIGAITIENAWIYKILSNFDQEM